MYEIRPMVGFKLLNRQFDKAVLRAIFDIENENNSLVKLVDHWKCWGYASRKDIAAKMGYSILDKKLSVKIRASFLWLEAQGYLKHEDINKPGMDPDRAYGATKFLLAFWVFRILSAGLKIEESFRAVKASFRTLVGKKPTHDRGIISMFSDLRVAEGLIG